MTPDHDYPSYLELRLTATDSGGLTDTQTLRLDPRTVARDDALEPERACPWRSAGRRPPRRSRARSSQGGTTTIAAPSPQTLGATTYTFGSWSDGGARSHTVTADADTTYTATFSP